MRSNGPANSDTLKLTPLTMAVGKGDSTSTNPSHVLDEISAKAPKGTVLPPRNIREIVEKTAGYVARNGAVFETRLREKQSDSNSKTTFILPDDAYNAYYRWRVDEIKAGRGTTMSAGRDKEDFTSRGRAERKGPEKPVDYQFSVRMPNISAQDLDVVRLTALFAAKNGRIWVTTLSQKETGNIQFDFLRPQHSLYQFFSRLVDQYTELLNGDSLDEGRPQKKRITELEANVENRFHLLERSRKRAEYIKWEAAQKEEMEEKTKQEEIAFAQIDWHDFVVVETVVFDPEDADRTLQPPPRLNDLQSASLEQKAAMSINPSHRIEEAMPDLDNYDQYNNQPTPAPLPQRPAPAVRNLPTRPSSTQTLNQPQTAYQTPGAPDEEPPSRVSALQADRARARAAQEAAKSSTSGIKVRKDYVPAAQQARGKAMNSSICPNCKQAIPNDEMSEHLRIEMLDPQWREQSKVAAHRSSTTNLSTADVAMNLKRLASQRTDVFDPVTGRALTAEEQERVKRPHHQQRNPAPVPSVASQNQPQRTTDVQEQIRQIHERARNG